MERNRETGDEADHAIRSVIPYDAFCWRAGHDIRTLQEIAGTKGREDHDGLHACLESGYDERREPDGQVGTGFFDGTVKDP